MAKYVLSDRGRRALDGLYTAIAQINGASRGVHSSFALDPTAEQRLEDLQREQVAFLQRINVLGVRDLIGQVIGLGTEDMIASRTAEEDLPRKPKYVGQTEGREYRLYDTEFDTKLPWQIIDAWSKFDDFAQRYSRHVAISVALSRIAVGWHGLTAAASTNAVTNPNGEDVNIGWLQKLRLEKADHVMGRATVTAGGVGGRRAHLHRQECRSRRWRLQEYRRPGLRPDRRHAVLGAKLDRTCGAGQPGSGR